MYLICTYFIACKYVSASKCDIAREQYHRSKIKSLGEVADHVVQMLQVSFIFTFWNFLTVLCF